MFVVNGTLTADQGIGVLVSQRTTYNTRTSLNALASQVEASSSGRVTVLYSGRVGSSFSAEEIAKNIEASTKDVRIINNSEVAKFLSSDEFLAAAARLDGVSLRQFTEPGYRSPTTDWLYHPADGPWAQASARFADGALGDVRVIAPNATPDRVFGATELPRILANENVTSVEGLPRTMLADLHAREGQQAVFEIVAAQSHANMSQLRVTINATGQPLREEHGRLDLDSRAYFRNSAVPRHLSEAKGGTRDLGYFAGPASDHVEAGTARLRTWQLELMPDAAPGIAPQSMRLARAVGHGAAVAGTGIEAASAAQDFARLRSEGNLTAAQSTLQRSASTAGGAWVGFEGGLAAGGVFGPGTALAGGALGAVIGGVGGDKLADKVDQWRVYTQRGSDGHTWQADPAHPERGWTRTLPPLPTAPQGQRFTASAEMADELNYKSLAKATELALPTVSARDPYTLPADRQDTPSAYGGDWTRNATNGAWQRQINFDRPGLGHIQTATAERASQLDVQSQQVVAENAATGQLALAASFKALYVHNDWQRHGRVPDAVENALAHPERVIASDGRRYTREADSQWTHDGRLWDSHASGNVRAELEQTFQAQRAHVQDVLRAEQSGERGIPTLDTVRVTPAPEQRTEGMPETARPPTQPGHPDYPLYSQIKEGVAALDAQHGRSFDATSERMSASLLALAKENDLQRVDHVLISNATARHPAGHTVFLVQGDLKDPLHARASMPTMQAVQTPVEQSLEAYEGASQQAQQRATSQGLEREQLNEQTVRAMQRG